MKVANQQIILSLALTLRCAKAALACPPPQWKPSKSDADISAVGHRNIAKGTNLYSLDHEKQLGKLLANQVEHSAKFVDDPDIANYVDRRGQTVARNSDARMRVVFRVIDADSLDSFTLPGGYQYIGRGLLLSVASEAELAGVLAHGIAETAMRSATKQASQGYLAQLAGAGVFVSNGSRGDPSPQANALAVSLASLKVQREQTSAADFFGLQYVYLSGYDPECYVEFLQRVLAQISSVKQRVPDDFSPLPPLADRIAAMRKAQILPKRDNAVVSTPQFKEFQDRVRGWKPQSK